MRICLIDLKFCLILCLIPCPIICLNLQFLMLSAHLGSTCRRTRFGPSSWWVPARALLPSEDSGSIARQKPNAPNQDQCGSSLAAGTSSWISTPKRRIRWSTLASSKGCSSPSPGRLIDQRYRKNKQDSLHFQQKNCIGTVKDLYAWNKNCQREH